ncbi:MAG: (d)CMP kinase [Longimicrobiales bacterium]|nr:(d)CMP kinase [Longimicrobiales bacterium]
MTAPSRTIVTLDGPAGVGKSTTARAVAERLGWRYLDSGALYRAVAHALLEEGIDRDAWPDLDDSVLHALGLTVDPEGTSLVIRRRGRPLGPELRTPEVTAAVSAVARIPSVRAWLLDAQRAAGSRGRLVADGRDMGTVVFPDAATKIFLTADPAERARRRLGDHGVTHPDPDEVALECARLEARDRADREREISPLRPASDALHLDTTELDFAAQVDAVVRHVIRRAGVDSERHRI